MINDSDGRSCVLFLTAGLTPVRHVMWQNLEGSSGKKNSQNFIKTWIFRLFDLSLKKEGGTLSIFNEGGKDLKHLQ